MKTFSLKADEIHKKWWVIDAQGLILGRLAAFIAYRLRGKHKPTFCPHLDCGDNIVVVNADKIAVRGKRKAEDKTYYWHTGYPGGIKETTTQKILEGKFPERVLFKAVQRMISRNSLGRRQMRNFFVYVGKEHPHQAQQPEFLDVAAFSPKNKGIA